MIEAVGHQYYDTFFEVARPFETHWGCIDSGDNNRRSYVREARDSVDYPGIFSLKCILLSLSYATLLEKALT